MTQNYRMINVNDKQVTRRRAIAVGTIKLSAQTMNLIRAKTSPKGDILSIAEVAGIMAAKNTSQTLPLCHPLLLDAVQVWFEIQEDQVKCFCEVVCEAKTGVEMEALVGVNATLLTIYDLAKAVDPVIEIGGIYLKLKEGGKSGVWKHPKEQTEHSHEATLSQTMSRVRFSVGTLSDRASYGIYEDKSGKILCQYLSDRGGREIIYKVIPDDEAALTSLIFAAAEQKSNVLLLTGGTGISSRDITPEVVSKLATKELIGFGELQRQYGAGYTKAAWLSRSSAYVVKDMLVVLFPGSPKAVTQGLQCVGELIPHAIAMMNGEGH